MSRKHFDKETKLKYVKVNLEFGIVHAVIEFLDEFEDRYMSTWLTAPRGKVGGFNPAVRSSQRIVIWTNKYNLLGEAGLVNMTGKTGVGKGQKKRPSINELNEHDRALYQEIMESVLRDSGIDPSIIQDKIKQRKEEKNQKFDNHKKACEVLGINRTSSYKKYTQIIKSDKSYLERNWVPGLIEWMRMQIEISDNVVGRDKLYITYTKAHKVHISSYVFRLHWESLDYKSSAYVRKNTDRPPKEMKYKGVFTTDLIKNIYSSQHTNQKWFADISYIKLASGWWYLHVITESYSNKIIAWSLTKDRTSNSTIKLLEKAFNNVGSWPEFFHTDHGVEYANQYVKNFLESIGVKQSMSPKGNSLANRPSEFLFALIKREKLYKYDLLRMQSYQVELLIDKYFDWYHNFRIQRNLQNKTPQAFACSRS